MKPAIRPLFALGLVLVLAGCQQQSATTEDTGNEPAAATPATPSAPARPTPASPYAPEITASIDRYEDLARDIAARLATPTDMEALSADLDALMTLSAEVTPAFIERHPDCKAYLEAALTLHQKWSELDAATIERDYHKDAALPAEGTPPVCYHMKDLIVHPATALVLLRQAGPDPASAKREIDEVIAHVAVVRAG